MNVLTDSNGYITDYAVEGTLEGGTEIPIPADLPHFEEHSPAYRLLEAGAVFDQNKWTLLAQERQQELIRALREKECFSYINRGQLWYETLSLSQLVELRRWYSAWLSAPTTGQIPERPSWLE